jgi:hypothetical protein
VSVPGNLLIALDQMINCLVRIDGEWGRPDETLSARAWRLREKHPQWPVWIDRGFFWDRAGDKRHCEISYDAEIARRHLPAEYRRADDAPQEGD